MALTKSQLYSSLWKSCDELRGGMDASQYKDYVLTLLFMKYVSDKYAGERDPVIEVPDGGSFADMAKCKGQKEIGERINKIISRFAEANDLKGVIDQVDFNDESKLGRGKAMQDRLTKLVAIFERLNFSANRAGGDDLLGDAYEYLMRHFATESGKAKGQFYTPAEVSRIMAQVIGIGPDTPQDRTIYDPTCGSGSLLLRAADQASGGLTIYGQEMDNATWGLARMNMILHGYPTADLAHGNTLADPRFTTRSDGLKTFHFAVANPPFSTKSWSNGLDPLNDPFGRFEDGVPPNNMGDFAFLLHLLKSLKSRGKEAIILPHGVLFRGNREAAIRRNLIRRGLIQGVIGLPANLFYGTPISACVVVINKVTDMRQGIFVIDASKGFRKDGAKNRLREADIHRIVDVFNRQRDIPGYSRMVPVAEIATSANDYNLNIPRYIDSTEPEDLHDVEAHLQGGIPNKDLNAFRTFDVFRSLRRVLFKPHGGTARSAARVRPEDMNATILGHEEYKAFEFRVRVAIDEWCDAHQRRLRAVSDDTNPKALLGCLGEDLLSRLQGLPLLDPYSLPHRLILGAYVRVGYFRGTELLFQDMIKGDLVAQVERPVDLLDTKYTRAFMSHRATERVEALPVPTEALREAVVNAVVRKDYATSIPIQIRVYDDRIVLWNSGRLPEGWSLEELSGSHPSHPYNPVISRMFSRAGLIEADGRGAGHIIETCQSAGSVPKWSIVSGGIQLELPFPGTYTVESARVIPKNHATVREVASATQEAPEIAEVAPQASQQATEETQDTAQEIASTTRETALEVPETAQETAQEPQRAVTRRLIGQAHRTHPERRQVPSDQVAEGRCHPACWPDEGRTLGGAEVTLACTQQRRLR